MIFSCLGVKQEWQVVDVAEFKTQVNERTDIATVEDLMLLYYNYPPNEEGASNIEVTGEQRRGTYVATLVHDKIADDSMRGIQLVLTAIKQKDGSWKVLGVQKNWKCWEGRGHTDWGVALCN